MSNAGIHLLFKLRSGTHELNEEFGRYRGRKGKCMCNLCGEDSESVGHFLWNRPTYSEHLKNNLEKAFEHFKSCDVVAGVTLKNCCAQLKLISSIYGNCTK